jgi:transposase-like protein
MDSVKRIRTHPTIIAYGMYLYFSSRSYRFTSKSLEPITKRTHVSIWKIGTEILYINRQGFVVGKRKIKKIFVDETLLKINGQDYHLWLAYEPNLHVCVCYFTFQEKEQFLYAISSLDRDKNKIWK